MLYDVSVRLSVTEVHWRIIANLGFKFRSQFTAHCGRGACGREGRDYRREEWIEGSSRAMLATVRPSNNMQFILRVWLEMSIYHAPKMAVLWELTPKRLVLVQNDISTAATCARDGLRN